MYVTSAARPGQGVWMIMLIHYTRLHDRTRVAQVTERWCRPAAVGALTHGPRTDGHASSNVSNAKNVLSLTFI